MVADSVTWEFRLQGYPVEVVSLYNKGEVVFKQGLSDEYKLVIASLSTVLLVRTNLSDE